jgi:pyridoxine kinase
VETVNTGYVGFPTVEIFFVMVKNIAVLKYYRINSEEDGREACAILHAAGPSKVVITSITIGGILLLIGSHQKEKGLKPEQFKILIHKIPAYFTGTGDLMTALLLGWSNKYPDNLDKAAELAVSTLQALLRRTLDDYKRAGYDPTSSSLEIRLIQSQEDIRNPKVELKAERYS